MGTSDKIKELEKKLKKVSEGDQVRIDKQHKAGKMTARERIEALLDADSFVELEQSLLLFRNSHARMVERMIGRRMGTGGSSGVDYLDETLKYRIFVDLWTVRTILVRRDLLPNVANSSYYEFNSQS